MRERIFYYYTQTYNSNPLIDGVSLDYIEPFVTYFFKTQTFTNYKSAIDAKHPVMTDVNSQIESSAHNVLCVGYNSNTGAAGGVIRDVLLNEEPVIFRKEIYAMACVAGGLAYWGLSYLGVSLYITVIVAFCVVCAIRLLAVRYHISLPKLRDEEQTVE